MGEFYEYNSGYYLPYNSINKTKWYQYGEDWKESNGQLLLLRFYIDNFKCEPKFKLGKGRYTYHAIILFL